ncbi:MAG: hypothetical protein J7L23_03270 [Candidatus Diapherotrites archaeon]|nr:hypothetical protein [Candidatus Diapherotrites archaeon]
MQLKKKRLGNKGLGMWVMSKTVLFIFLLLLVAVLSGFLNIYQKKVIEDSARSVIMLWAESANSVAQFPSGSAIWPLQQQVIIKSAGRKVSVAKDYTTGIVALDSPDGKRLVFMLAWGDHNETKIEDIPEYATAVSTGLPLDITNVYFFNGSTTPGDPPTYLQYAGNPKEEIIVRPSIGGTRDAYIVFYRNQTTFCIGTIKQTETDLKTAVGNIATCCNAPSSCP